MCIGSELFDLGSVTLEACAQAKVDSRVVPLPLPPGWELSAFFFFFSFFRPSFRWRARCERQTQRHVSNSCRSDECSPVQ